MFMIVSCFLNNKLKSDPNRAQQSIEVNPITAISAENKSNTGILLKWGKMKDDIAVSPKIKTFGFINCNRIPKRKLTPDLFSFSFFDGKNNLKIK